MNQDFLRGVLLKVAFKPERTMSPAPSRNGAWVNKWRLATGKRETVKAWLSRHGFDPEEIAEKQLELA